MASFARTRLCGRTISRSAPVEIRCAKRSAGSTSKGLSRSGRGEGTSSPDGAGGDYRGLRHAHGARGTCGFHGRRLHLCRIINTLRDSAESYIRLSVESTGLGEAWAMHQEMFEGFRDGDAIHVARPCRRHVRHSAHALLERLRVAREEAAEGRFLQDNAAVTPARRPRVRTAAF
jgi:hypothetical protein